MLVALVDELLAFTLGFTLTVAAIALWGIAMELARIRRLLEQLSGGKSTAIE